MKPTLLIQNDQRGSVILAVLMILLGLSVLGIAAIFTTTTQVQVSGNYRFQTEIFYEADGGRKPTFPALDWVFDGGPIPLLVSDLALPIELNDPPDSPLAADDPLVNPDISYLVGTRLVRVDIDKKAVRSSPGSSSETAKGYYGVGMSSSNAGTVYSYQVDAIVGVGVSQSQVSHIYNRIQ